MKWIVIFIGVLSVIGGASAFPGSETDEQCYALQSQGIEVDCVTNPGLSAMELRAAKAEMAFSPMPNVTQVPPQEDIVNPRRYRRLDAGATIYDAPGGNPIRTVDSGLTLVSYIGWIDGWIQLRVNEWVPEEVTRPYEVSPFAGVEINQPLDRPFAWMLAPVKPSLYPGGPPHESYNEIERYSLLNIYGTELVDGWRWYLVGPNQWIEQIRVSKVQPIARPAEVLPDEKWIAVDLYEQSAVAYDGEEMVFATLISSGLPQWSTNEGLFKVYQRWLYGPMSGAAGVLGDAYYIENIPHIMYFDNDIALHAAYWHDLFGYRQSRGCVNLSMMDAYWLYEWTRDDEDVWVFVYSSDDYRNDLPPWAIRSR